MLILHNCDNPNCINPSHLRQGTVQDNSDDMVKRGRSIKGRIGLNKIKGEQHPFAILAEADILKIRRLLSEKITCTEIARKFNVGYTTISKIKHRKTWKHI